MCITFSTLTYLIQFSPKRITFSSETSSLSLNLLHIPRCHISRLPHLGRISRLDCFCHSPNLLHLPRCRQIPSLVYVADKSHSSSTSPGLGIGGFNITPQRDTIATLWHWLFGSDCCVVFLSQIQGFVSSNFKVCFGTLFPSH
ncbi:hypothetical protein QL285_088100 [Trifolium repens]|nr:hypothetical protein QL285_088100 [Trifolium repens]